MFRILDAEQDADAAGSLHAFEVRGAVDPKKRLILVGEERVPRGEELQVLHVGVRPPGSDRDVKDVDA